MMNARTVKNLTYSFLFDFGMLALPLGCIYLFFSSIYRAANINSQLSLMSVKEASPNIYLALSLINQQKSYLIITLVMFVALIVFFLLMPLIRSFQYRFLSGMKYHLVRFYARTLISLSPLAVAFLVIFSALKEPNLLNKLISHILFWTAIFLFDLVNCRRAQNIKLGDKLDKLFITQSRKGKNKRIMPLKLRLLLFSLIHYASILFALLIFNNFFAGGFLAVITILLISAVFTLLRAFFFSLLGLISFP